MNLLITLSPYVRWHFVFAVYRYFRRTYLQSVWGTCIKRERKTHFFFTNCEFLWWKARYVKYQSQKF